MEIRRIEVPCDEGADDEDGQCCHEGDAHDRDDGSAGDWWALGKVESAVQNPDGSMRTFSVEVGISLAPRGDYLHCEADFWKLVGEKLPDIARIIAAGGRAH